MPQSKERQVRIPRSRKTSEAKEKGPHRPQSRHWRGDQNPSKDGSEIPRRESCERCRPRRGPKEIILSHKEGAKLRRDFVSLRLFVAKVSLPESDQPSSNRWRPDSPPEDLLQRSRL